MVARVAIPRDLITALANPDLLEMDTPVQVIFHFMTKSRIKDNFFFSQESERSGILNP